MITKSLRGFSRVALAATMLAVTALPSQAEIWPGVGPAPGGALAARVIGLMCPNSLSHAEIYELDVYIAKKRLEGMTKPGSDPVFERNFYPTLEAKYIELYRDGKRCTADETAAAKDMVERVRNELKPAAK